MTETAISDQEQVRAAVDYWMSSLDSGDLEGVMSCCHDEIVMANGGSPTATGIDTMRERYAARISQFQITSGWNEETLVLNGDTAVVVGRYTVSMRPKSGGEVNEIAGRVALTYVRDAEDAWKIIADVDNT